jgi:hypothetical protein
VFCVQLLAVYVIRTFTHTSHLLFSSGSLVNYWRTELGGNPDEDDPYDIQPGVEVFKERDVGRPAGKHEGILRGGFADERRRRHTRGWKGG